MHIQSHNCHYNIEHNTHMQHSVILLGPHNAKNIRQLNLFYIRKQEGIFKEHLEIKEKRKRKW